MLIKFDKMQALGNDFVMIDAEQLPQNLKKPPQNFISTICSRNYGIGCDTLVLYWPKDGEIFATFFNPDGSEAEICGNAARCLGLLMKKLFAASNIVLKTHQKSYPIQVDKEISVNMGQPSFDPEKIGIDCDCASSIFEKLNLPGEIYDAFCISVGNPHLVLFCENTFEKEKIMEIGASLEKHPLFKHRINVSFAHIFDKNKIDLAVFERGAGLTFACGSGACAAAAAAHINHLISSDEILVKQKGGDLKICLDDDGNIFQIGSASHVFWGEIDL
ncbi:MAG: diaminopimelate epimerase [Holosporaceae bacterium]|jgi:diaminopimelate epimerase|nr:diaminopimelate epimerase [Holosporaceae bacterium]